jgi:hypothetical protein
MVRKKNCPNCGSRKISKRIMNGSVMSAGLNFQEGIEEEPQKKVENNGDYDKYARALLKKG